MLVAAYITLAPIEVNGSVFIVVLLIVGLSEDQRPYDFVQSHLNTTDTLTVVAPADVHERSTGVAHDHEDPRHTAPLPLNASRRASDTAQ